MERRRRFRSRAVFERRSYRKAEFRPTGASLDAGYLLADLRATPRLGVATAWQTNCKFKEETRRARA
jgi:hypothetical protein